MDPLAGAAWSSADAPAIAAAGQGPTSLRVFRAAEGGYLLDHCTFGRFLVGGDAEKVQCAPSDPEAWRWQRFLVGQVLPLVSVLRGHEVIHASAVALGGSALLLAGPSGAGKTTAAMALAGAPDAELLADDVAAVAHGPEGVVVHPGAALASVKDGSQQSTADVLGTADGESRVRIDLGQAPRPISHVVLLEPRRDGDRVRLTAAPGPLAPLLLGLTFNGYVQDRTRLERQFDLLAALASQARVVRAQAPRSLGVGALAHELRRAAGGPII